MDEQNKYYQELILKHEDPKWREFTGMCFLCSLDLDLTTEQLCEYIFETFHGLSIEEIEGFFKDYNELTEDIRMYFKN